MHGDDVTLVAPFEHRLLRASYAVGDEDPALLLVAFDSPVARHRVLALRGLVRRSMMTDGLWRRALRADDVDVRRDALEQLAHASIDEPSLLDMVTSLLADEDALVVDGAAFALGEHLWRGAVMALCDVAEGHDDPRCRESAVAALGAIGDDRARATIIAALDDKPAVRRRAVVALANFEGSDIEAALSSAGEDRDWQVRSAVEQLHRKD